MAYTDFEKEMIDIIDRRCRRGSTDPAKHATFKAHIDTLMKGTEAEVQTLISDFINDEGMVAETDGQITALNAKVAELNARKTNMSSYSP